MIYTSTVSTGGFTYYVTHNWGVGDEYERPDHPGYRLVQRIGDVIIDQETILGSTIEEAFEEYEALRNRYDQLDEEDRAGVLIELIDLNTNEALDGEQY